MGAGFDKSDIDAVRAAARLADVAGALGVTLKRAGREWLGLCPFHAEKTPSFTVFRKGGADRFKCFGCNEAGDVFALVQKINGDTFPEAVRWVADLAGVALAASDRPPDHDPGRARRRAEVEADRRRRDAEAAAAERRDLERRASDACAIWQAARPAAGTIVEAYLAARGIDLNITGLPPALRFAPALAHSETRGRHPAMVAGVQEWRGRVTAVHITYLLPDGSGKADVSPAKRMRGPAWGGAVRLSPPGLDASHRLFLAEGIETGLSALQMEIRAGREACVWAALSLGNLAGGGQGRGKRRTPEDAAARRESGRAGNAADRLPSETPDPLRDGILVPFETREIVLCSDGDGKDPPAAEALLARAAQRFIRGGFRARIARPPAGLDWNDVLNLENRRKANA